MTRRLIVTGFPCSAEPWLALFEESDTKVLTLAEVMGQAKVGDLKKMAAVVRNVISEYSPDQIVAHDIGLTVTILALLRLMKNKMKLPNTLVLFNGAFSGFDVLQARHPLWIQVKSTRMIKNELEHLGITLDPKLVPLLPLVKQMYRQIIFASLLDRARSLGKSKELKINWGIKTLILEGENDPFIPATSIAKLAHTLVGAKRMVRYSGHFPYQADRLKILAAIEAFENAQ